MPDARPGLSDETTEGALGLAVGKVEEVTGQLRKLAEGLALDRAAARALYDALPRCEGCLVAPWLVRVLVMQPDGPPDPWCACDGCATELGAAGKIWEGGGRIEAPWRSAAIQMRKRFEAWEAHATIPDDAPRPKRSGDVERCPECLEPLPRLAELRTDGVPMTELVCGTMHTAHFADGQVAVQDPETYRWRWV